MPHIYINIKGSNGETPLHKAAKNGHVDMVKLLISNGANKNIKNNDGKTAKDIAAENVKGLL